MEDIDSFLHEIRDEEDNAFEEDNDFEEELAILRELDDMPQKVSSRRISCRKVPAKKKLDFVASLDITLPTNDKQTLLPEKRKLPNKLQKHSKRIREEEEYSTLDQPVCKRPRSQQTPTQEFELTLEPRVPLAPLPLSSVTQSWITSKGYSQKPLDGSCIYVTSSSGERVFIPVEEEQQVKLSGVNNQERYYLSASTKELQKQVAELERKKFLLKIEEESQNSNDIFLKQGINVTAETELWVDKYSPHTFVELLSDGKTNREVLSWLKEWDPYVFKKEFVESTLPTKDKNQKNKIPNLEKKRPQEKILLLHGAPGVGKTTLAHIVAKNAGYEPIEINASDERTEKKFMPQVIDIITMQSVGAMLSKTQNRPKCLIIDEIDGVLGKEGKGAINGLVKLIDEKVSKKNKKSSGDKLHRPIICICNDPWVPALKPLKERARLFVLHPPKSKDLLSRLQLISKLEKVNIDARTLQALCEITNNDIRACINTLQFLSKFKGYISGEILTRAVFGSKDMTDSIFDVWNSIFIKNTNTTVLQSLINKHISKNSENHLSDSSRDEFSRLYDTIIRHGHNSIILEGCFQNYLDIKFNDPLMTKTQSTLEWFEFSSIMSAFGIEKWFELERYLPLSALAVHVNCHVSFTPSIKFPRKEKEYLQGLAANSNILQSYVHGMSPSIRQTFSSFPVFVTDFLFYFVQLINPTRIAGTVSGLHINRLSEAQRDSIQRAASVYLDYGLNWLETKKDSMEILTLVPPITIPISFTSSGIAAPDKPTSEEDASRSEHLPDTVTMGVPPNLAQIMAKAVSTEKQKRIEARNRVVATTAGSKLPKPSGKGFLSKVSNKAPEKPIVEEIVEKDFFGRKVTRTVVRGKKSSPPGKVTPVSVQIQYKHQEGFTNAVRRNVYIKDFM